MGDLWYRQEYGCEFVDAVSGVFDRDLVEQAITDDVLSPAAFDWLRELTTKTNRSLADLAVSGSSALAKTGMTR